MSNLTTDAIKASRRLFATLQARNHCQLTGVVCRSRSPHRCGCFLLFMDIVLELENHGR